MGGSEQAVASSSRLREPTLGVQSCLLLDSDASAEPGEADISADAESFASPQGVTDDHETQRLRPMQATKQRQARHTGMTLQPTLTQYTQ